MSGTVRALASPASLKGVLTPAEAAAHLAAGLRRVDGVEADEAPVADGGEGTAAVLQAALGGTWRTAAVADPLGRPVAARWLLLPDGTAVMEAAEAIGLPRLRPEERDPLAASSRGLGELLLAALVDQPTSLLVCVGGTATVDGAELVLDRIGFDRRAAGAALVVTGEGTVDATTFDGKAPGTVRAHCARLGVRCELFGGVVADACDAHRLSGDPALAAEDLVQLGEELALSLSP